MIAALLVGVVAACGPAPSGEKTDSGALELPAEGDTGIGEPAEAPRFSSVSPLDLARLEEVSLFRSAIGHDYSDDRETCRSMKHYLCANGCETGVHQPSWTTLEVRSPVDGVIVRVEEEQSGFGAQVVIQPTGYEAWEVRLFHLATDGLVADAPVAAGDVLGRHASDDTLSDVAVWEFTEGGVRLVSFFDTLNRDAFAPWRARGVPSRAALQLSEAARDADPLLCDGERFLSRGSLPDWFVLDP